MKLYWIDLNITSGWDTRYLGRHSFIVAEDSIDKAIESVARRAKPCAYRHYWFEITPEKLYEQFGVVEVK